MAGGVRVTVAGSGDASGTGGRLPTCLHVPGLQANTGRMNHRRLLLTPAGPQVLAADRLGFDLAHDGMVLGL